MKYPELLLLPVLMFSDYFLTILSQIRQDQKYGKHFKTPHFELNPTFQKAVAERKWINPRHIFFTIIFSAYIIGLMEFVDLPQSFVQGVAGTLIVLYAAINARHISNLLLFRYLKRWPGEITGELNMTYAMVTATSIFGFIGVFIPVVAIAIFSPTPFAIGGVTGIILLILLHLKWLRKARIAARKAAIQSTTATVSVQENGQSEAEQNLQ